MPGSLSVAASAIDSTSSARTFGHFAMERSISAEQAAGQASGILAKGDLHRPRGIITDIQMLCNAMNIWGQMFYTAPVWVTGAV